MRLSRHKQQKRSYTGKTGMSRVKGTERERERGTTPGPEWQRESLLTICPAGAAARIDWLTHRGQRATGEK